MTMPTLTVKKGEDGFYPVTSFGSLYRGLQVLYGDGKFHVELGEKHTYLFLLTDAKPVDEFAEDHKKLQGVPAYKDTVKYVALTEEQTEKYSDTTVEFVDYRADRIVRMEEMPNEIRKLKMTELSGGTQESFGAEAVFSKSLEDFFV
jgi:hypothetical protein